MIDIKDALIKAADLIEKNGLTKGRFINSDKCHCTVGAINEVTGKWPTLVTEESYHVIAFFGSYIDTYTEDPEASIYSWNDEEERTQEQVVNELRKAAVLA